MHKQITKGRTQTTIFESIQYELHMIKSVSGQIANGGAKVRFRKGEQVEVNLTCAELFAKHGKLELAPIIFTTKNAMLKKYKKKRVFTVREVKLDMKVKEYQKAPKII